MPARFDWEAEDEKGWDEVKAHERPETGGWRPNRRLQLVVLAFAVITIIVLLAMSQINRLLESSAAEAERDLLNGHRLVLEAAANKDGDLLGGMIFDRLHDWTSAQVLVAEHGLLVERDSFDIHLAHDGEPVSTEVDLEPGLIRALVTETLRYRVGDDEQRPDIIELRHVYSYRFEDDRWLLSPPTGAFWGSWLSIGGRYLTLSYPERDAQLGQRLAADLEAAIAQACHSVEGMNCQDDLHLDVILVADPESIVAMSNPFWRLLGGPSIELPTPTLMGVPADEAAYRAILHAYADRVVARLIAKQTDLEQISQPLLGAIIVDRILDQMGLRSWSGTAYLKAVEGEAPDGEVQHLAGDVMYQKAQALWSRNMPLVDQPGAEDAQTFGALVEFLTGAYSDTPEAEMLRLLIHASTLQEWLVSLNPEASISTFIDAWDLYVAENFLETEQTSRPNEPVLLTSEHGVFGVSNLNRQLLDLHASGRDRRGAA